MSLSNPVMPASQAIIAGDANLEIPLPNPSEESRLGSESKEENRQHD
jgi:hypothetical protein